MNTENKLTLTIEDVAFGGAGVARQDKQVVFVPRTLKGETIEAAVVEDKKKFLQAKVTQVLEPSPNRQEAKCPYFSLCQGCAYQHTSYEHQLELKKKQVSDLLQRIGKIDSIPEIQVIGSDSAYGFRNKIKMHVKKEQENWSVGFIGEDNKTIIDIEECAIAHPAINARLKVLREEVSKESENFEGTWMARTNSKGKEKDFFFEKGEEKFEALPLIKEEAYGKSFVSPFESFFQTNHEMLNKLIAEVESTLKLDKDDLFVDAYSGVGLFTLLFAPKVKNALGIEQDFRAIGCANKNKEIQHIKNAKFIGGKVEDKLATVLERNTNKNIPVLLDPPRRGCQTKVLEAITKNKIKKVVYVSCNPSTFARDLAHLTSEGYKLEKLTLIDMFPQTAHIELVALIDKI